MHHSGGMDTVLDAHAIPAAPMTIRLAGIGDITAIARITHEGPPRSDLDPELVARTNRLLLTHVAFTEGALWVEHGPDGVITRAVAVIPGANVTPWQAIGRVVGPDLAAVAPMPPGDAEVGRALEAELVAAGPAWVMSEISRAPSPRQSQAALLGAALDWARREQAGHGGGDEGAVVVVADSEPEAQAARSLGFVELPGPGAHPGWWIGSLT